MVCGCCKPDNGQRNSGKTAPPKRPNMKEREQMAMDEDAQAVDWWRSHTQSKDEDDDCDSDGATMKLQQSQSRMEQRNPLAKPYSLHSRELPLNPKNGDIIHPSNTPAAAKKHPVSPSTNNTETATTNTSIEVFEPEADTVGSHSASTEPMHSYGSKAGPIVQQLERRQLPRKEEIKVVAPVRESQTGELFRDPPAANYRDPVARHRQFGSMRASKTTQRVLKEEPMKPSKKSATVAADDDHLSDIPSDIDSVTRERYLLACQMLKTQLIAKEKALVTIEREFILSLLGDYEKQLDDASAITEDQVSTIEHAALKLDVDPLFQSIDVPNNDSVQSPMTAASLQMKDRDADEVFEVIPKNPHTATRKPKRKFAPRLMNPCNPTRFEEPADNVMIIPEKPAVDDHGATDDWALVRFDGWKFHMSTEYPFTILGANNSKLHPRVLTPALMEAFRGFFPFGISDSNFWLKFSMIRDGASLATLLASVRASVYTIIAVETNHGEVFGSFTGTPWRTGTKWYGNGEAFLWRLKKSRLTSRKNSLRANFENEMEVYPYTGYDELVQYCTPKTIAIGGGDWQENASPFSEEPRGIGFMVDGDLAGGETNSCATFANPRLCKKVSASNEFNISNIEVWTLTPCSSVREAAQLEMKKLFLNENFQMLKGAQ